MSGSEEEHLVSLTFRKNEDDDGAENDADVKEKEKVKPAKGTTKMEFVNQVSHGAHLELNDLLSKNSWKKETKWTNAMTFSLLNLVIGEKWKFQKVFEIYAGYAILQKINKLDLILSQKPTPPPLISIIIIILSVSFRTLSKARKTSLICRRRLPLDRRLALYSTATRPRLWVFIFFCHIQSKNCKTAGWVFSFLLSFWNWSIHKRSINKTQPKSTWPSIRVRYCDVMDEKN